MRPGLAWGVGFFTLLVAACVEPRQDSVATKGIPEVEAGAVLEEAGAGPGPEAGTPDAALTVADGAPPQTDGSAAPDLLGPDTGVDAPPPVPDAPLDGP